MNNHISIQNLQENIRQFVGERDWGQFHNPKDLSISLALEAAEVLEHFQWKNDAEMAKHSTERKQDVADELADVLYWTLLLANKLDIDLTKAFSKKMAANAEKYPIDKAKGNHKKYTELAE